MGKNTRIYNKFKGYYAEDCECIYCIYYFGKRGCSLDKCCCGEERDEAYQLGRVRRSKTRNRYREPAK